eukprot:CAMPEP_0119299018 /NCGR_PEP_ID=MMETSP1333-20130426/1143_1 /TAXON_ID=418940 /ORGANISM="Scyphosphaera apsteinii, Strain RCC1455" /LENGTH=221 /DNA_ID=CAMNT_0007300297 /DNA_START=203 /DNA_END=865 /DNA_ORIENTATION=+
MFDLFSCWSGAPDPLDPPESQYVRQHGSTSLSDPMITFETFYMQGANLFKGAVQIFTKFSTTGCMQSNSSSQFSPPTRPAIPSQPDLLTRPRRQPYSKMWREQFQAAMEQGGSSMRLPSLDKGQQQHISVGLPAARKRCRQRSRQRPQSRRRRRRAHSSPPQKPESAHQSNKSAVEPEVTSAHENSLTDMSEQKELASSNEHEQSNTVSKQRGAPNAMNEQ